MKKNVLTLLFCLGAMAAFNTNSHGQTLIHYWNFNNFTSAITLPAVASLAADYSVIDTAKARMTDIPIPGTSSSYSSYCDFVTGDTTNARQGAAAGNGFRARNPNDSMELLFYIPSTNYKNLVFKYATMSSSYTSGDSIQIFSYSLDSGSTWVSSGSGLSEWIDSAQLAFSLKTIVINDTNANNNRKLVFRIRTAGRNTGGSGNNRYDNVTLEGTVIVVSVPEIEKTTTLNIYPNPVVNTLEIVSELDGVKSVRIFNAVGQTLYEGSEAGKHISVNTGNLCKGSYFISIREYATGEVKTLRFVKL